MTTIHLSAESRWDALELMDSLLPYHPYLVQKGPSDWDVVGHAELDRPRLLDDLQGRIRTALRRRSLTQAEVTFDDGSAVVVDAGRVDD